MSALAPEGTDDDVAVLVAYVPDRRRHEPAHLAIEADMRAVHERARVRRARRSTAGRCRARSSRDAVLLVSEMVTNAIVHGRAPIELRLRRGRPHLLLEVDDTATAVPRKLRPTPSDVHGRGLQLVAQIADQWGTRPTADGKSVWCVLALARYPAGSS